MLKTAPCVVLASLKASTYSEYASAFRSLRPCRGTVLSILQAIENNHQLRSRIAQSFNVQEHASALRSAEALLDSDFEHPGENRAVSKPIRGVSRLIQRKEPTRSVPQSTLNAECAALIV